VDITVPFRALKGSGDAVSLEDCRDQLEEVLEEWLLFRLSRQLPVPVLDGMDLVVREVA
jgi:hypothetical protein